MPTRALVIDDDEASARLIVRMLRRLDCDASFVIDPHQAAPLTMSNLVDLITLDITMPGLDGYDVLTLIRSHEHTRRTSSVPVVAITGRASLVDRAATLASGFVAHITKPVMIESLRAAVDRALRLRPELMRTQHSVDRAAIEASLAELDSRSFADSLQSAAGLALAMEQQGRSLLQRTLELWQMGDRSSAVEATRRLGDLARLVRAHHLGHCCDDLQKHSLPDLRAIEVAAVLARAELDRVIFTLRAQVVH
jgi:CheY-like chemotaxis protein